MWPPSNSDDQDFILHFQYGIPTINLPLPPLVGGGKKPTASNPSNLFFGGVVGLEFCGVDSALPKNRPKRPKKKGSFLHHFSRAYLLLVSLRRVVVFFEKMDPS